ncbi:phosphate signaling complex protein PhoU [Thiomicrorhabdus indica]|uniref:phosphate signaling complex protein PhoU n=1 Tax=Thiomicrorhabdus indica TaxID=2267253 RepID=UPI00102DF4DA|nr:phosphate signaling complex protein PhoU [Thiomicrorhabdus indica]
MEREEFSTHISEQLNRNIEALFNEVARMGGLVESQLTNLRQALETGNIDLAKEALATDELINQEEMEIDRLSAAVLARQQPTASDLRLIVMAIRVAVDLERMGDEAVKIAKLAIHQCEEEVGCTRLPCYNELCTLMQSGEKMIQKTLNGFSRLDISDVLWVYQEEERMDMVLADALVTVRSKLASETDLSQIDVLTDMFMSIRAAERVTDHALNVAESVVYLVKGIDIRKMGEEEIAKLIEDDKNS